MREYEVYIDGKYVGSVYAVDKEEATKKARAEYGPKASLWG